MTQAVSDALLSPLSEFVESRMGLHFPIDRWGDLRRGIVSAAQDFGFGDAESCVRWLMSSPLRREQIEVLASHLTVGETYFLRDTGVFDILEQHILPELIRSSRGREQRLRIWSAGCCTGEEPYSIAILLTRLIPDPHDWHVTILGTDLNPRFLQRASAGVYREWSFRGTPRWIREQYFTRTSEGHYEIRGRIKKMVRFSYLNMAEDVYPSLLNDTNAMDVIFCRNVVMYFALARVKKVIENLHRCLVDGGWLVVSPTEGLHLLYSRFEPVRFVARTLYKKTSGSRQLVEGMLRHDVTPVSTRAPATGLPEQPFNTHPETECDAVQPQRFNVPVVGEPTPSTPPDPYEEALELYKQGRYADAEAELRDLLTSRQADVGGSNHDGEAMALLGRALANQGKLDEALEWCGKAVTVDKLNPRFHYLRATILQEEGEVEDAVKSLQRALYLDQNFVLAHFVMGNIAREQEKLDEASKHFANARHLLLGCAREEVLPESEGITAGRLLEIITSMTQRDAQT